MESVTLVKGIRRTAKFLDIDSLGHFTCSVHMPMKLPYKRVAKPWTPGRRKTGRAFFDTAREIQTWFIARKSISAMLLLNFITSNDSISLIFQQLGGSRHTETPISMSRSKKTLKRDTRWTKTFLLKMNQFMLPISLLTPSTPSSPFEVRSTGAPRTRRSLHRRLLPRLHAHLDLPYTPQERLQRHPNFRSGLSVE